MLSSTLNGTGTYTIATLSGDNATGSTKEITANGTTANVSQRVKTTLLFQTYPQEGLWVGEHLDVYGADPDKLPKIYGTFRVAGGEA